MKKSQAALAFTALLMASVVVGGTIFVVANFYLSKSSSTSECKTAGKNHSVTIQNDTFSEKQINAVQCDTLTIRNADDKVRLIAFGEHTNHEPYDGVSEKQLQKDGSFKIVLNKTGTYEVHDHLQDETQAFFTVTKQ
jgi:lipopolysaccharide export LptBFGC system permease protein LptF